MMFSSFFRELSSGPRVNKGSAMRTTIRLAESARIQKSLLPGVPDGLRSRPIPLAAAAVLPFSRETQSTWFMARENPDAVAGLELRLNDIDSTSGGRLCQLLVGAKSPHTNALFPINLTAPRSSWAQNARKYNAKSDSDAV